jgi:hypothetical protein
VYTETRGHAKTLPGDLDGIEVQVKPAPGGFNAGPAYDTVTRIGGGEAKSEATRRAEAAQRAATEGGSTRSGPGGDPTIRFDRPVPIGVSAFNATEAICATGTLGCRCVDSGGKLYALSNSHVFSKEGASLLGEEIVQPGQLDNGCNTAVDANLIGRLIDFMPSFINPTTPFYPVNFMDCALIEVVDSVDPEGNVVPAVGADTPDDGYGFPSSRVIRNPRIGQFVQKYGRTTGYTRGICTGLNNTGLVGGGSGLKPYAGMLLYISSAPYGAFGQPGDSGSLIVTLDERRPVGLLFAGGPNVLGIDETLANPIGLVLDRFNVRVDDGQSADVTTGGDANEGMTGRQGGAITPLGQDDKFFLLPPELWGRVKNPKRGINPILPLGPQVPA